MHRQTTTKSRRFWFALAALALAAAMLQAPDPAAAQDASSSSSSAWWARVGVADEAVRCPATLAWLRAIDVEQRDEEQATTEDLADVASGPELAREQQQLGEAAPQTDRPWAIYSSWSVPGGTSQEAVVYATRVVRSGPPNAAGDERRDAERVETTHAAYRIVLEDGVWRLADRHVFEQAQHAVSEDLGLGVIQQYQQLMQSLVQAYNARDADALEVVLDGPALEQYQAAMQQLDDQHDDRTVQYDGRLGLIDVEPSGALVDFEGTRTFSAAGADASASAQVAEPTTLIHRLQLIDGQWKIVDESEATSRRDADGTEHVDGCG